MNPVDPQPPVVVPPVVDPPVVDQPIVDQPIYQVPVDNTVPAYMPVGTGTGVVRVAAQAPVASGQQLAYTGVGEQAPLMAIGAGLLVAGAGAMLATRARKGRRRTV